MDNWDWKGRMYLLVNSKSHLNTIGATFSTIYMNLIWIPYSFWTCIGFIFGEVDMAELYMKNGLITGDIDETFHIYLYRKRRTTYKILKEATYGLLKSGFEQNIKLEL